MCTVTSQSVLNSVVQYYTKLGEIEKEIVESKKLDTEKHEHFVELQELAVVLNYKSTSRSRESPQECTI